jgi:hypothetical protein
MKASERETIQMAIMNNQKWQLMKWRKKAAESGGRSNGESSNGGESEMPKIVMALSVK